MASKTLIPPNDNELEVSVFGPGYGEAVALHYGEGKWIVVDSCIPPGSKVPAPLHYLNSIGVDPARAVQFIVATHWHDDHIRGISTLLSSCRSATFVLSEALQRDEFLKLVYHYRPPHAIPTLGLDEMARILQIIDARKRADGGGGRTKYAIVDRLLFRDELRRTGEPVSVKMHSLSPCDDEVLESKLGFAQLLPKPGERVKRLVDPDRNSASVVLVIEIGKNSVLLGADLQNTTSSHSGWAAVLDNSEVTFNKASFFKVPHHGSDNAHHDRVWTDLLTSDPVAVLSPWTKGGKSLPMPSDVKRISGLTRMAYTTARPGRKRTRWGERVVDDTVRSATKSMHSVNFEWGHVRARRLINNETEDWQIALFGEAISLR